VLSSTDFKVVPVITSFTPASGAAGVKVTITGNYFSGVQSVTFGGVSADFVVNSLTQITATVPANALAGRIVVTTAGGSGQSTVDFGVPPRITSVTPLSGRVGTRVTISGANFLGATSVKFNTTVASLPTITATSISVLVPAGAATGRVSVTTPAGTATSTDTFTVLQPPTITGFTPAAGKSGTKVTITGTNFTGTTSVKFNGVAASGLTITATSIVAPVPSAATTGKIAVTTPGGTVSSAASFVVDAVAPTLTLVPATGVVLQQLPATFSGTVGDNNGISNVTKVVWRFRGTFGGVLKYWNATTQSWVTSVVDNATTPTRPATATTWNSTGALPAGTTNLPDGSYTAYALAFDAAGYSLLQQSAITIDRVAPTASVTAPANGTTITTLPASLAGTVNDNRGASALSRVDWSLSRLINGVTTYWNPATQTWVSAAVWTATTPTRPSTSATWNSSGALPTGVNLASGSYTAKVTATDAAGNTTTAQSSFTVAPAVTYSISGRVTLGTAALPNVRIARTGTTATVLTDANGNYVLIGVPGNATYTITPTLSGYTFSPTKINVTLAAASVSGQNFAATKIPAPTITGFSPASGAAGTAVTISGTNLSGATSVKFNGVAAVINSTTSAQIVATVPATATTGKISVTTGGGTASSTTSYTVVAADTTKPTVVISAPTAGAVATAPTASGTASDSESGVGAVYVELGRLDATGTLTHLYDWTTRQWTTDGNASGVDALAAGTTSWSIALPPLSIGKFRLYATALDNAPTANQADWISRDFNTTTVSNDAFAKAYALKGTSGIISGGNVGATKEAGEPAHAGNAGGKSIWYSWTPASSGTATFSTAGSSFDTIMGIYTGTSVSALTQIGFNDDEQAGTITTSKASVTVVAGTNYRIAVDGYDGDAGDVVLQWTLIAAQGSTAETATPVATSPYRLSSAVARASREVSLAFTGPLQAATALDPQRYILRINGVNCEVESARLDGSGTSVVLTLPEGSIANGAQVQISWKLRDSAGRLLEGKAGPLTAR
jgi:hypothetical protein